MRIKTLSILLRRHPYSENIHTGEKTLTIHSAEQGIDWLINVIDIADNEAQTDWLDTRGRFSRGMIYEQTTVKKVIATKWPLLKAASKKTHLRS